MKKAKEMRELSDLELEQRERDCAKEYFELRMKKASGKIENPLQLRHLRREIARVKTILHQRTSGAR